MIFFHSKNVRTLDIRIFPALFLGMHILLNSSKLNRSQSTEIPQRIAANGNNMAKWTESDSNFPYVPLNCILTNDNRSFSNTKRLYVFLIITFEHNQRQIEQCTTSVSMCRSYETDSTENCILLKLENLFKYCIDSLFIYWNFESHEIVVIAANELPKAVVCLCKTKHFLEPTQDGRLCF